MDQAALVIAVPGHGPKSARVAFVGEAPAKHELKEGLPFVGPSGEVLWPLALRYANLVREESYTTNWCKRELEGKSKEEKLRGMAEGEADAWTRLLWEELRRLPNLEFVVALGSFAVDALLPEMDITMEIGNGMPFRCAVFPDRVTTVIPVFHPAAGLHDSNRLAFTVDGLERAGRIIKGTASREPMEDSHPAPVYRECALPALCLPGWPMGLDTEGSVEEPKCLTWSTHPGEAGLIRATDRASVALFGTVLRMIRPLVILHNALWDLEVLLAMGIDLVGWGIPFTDTMTILYNMQTEPKGLKAAARRWCGMRMTSYEDTVRPVEESFLRAYLILAKLENWPAPEGRKKSITARIEGLLNPRPTKKGTPRSLWERWHDKDFKPRAVIVARCGEAPKPTMDDIPNFLEYACRDADATRRLYLVLLPVAKELGIL